MNIEEIVAKHVKALVVNPKKKINKRKWFKKTGVI
jgi:hypothetical protein